MGKAACACPRIAPRVEVMSTAQTSAGRAGWHQCRWGRSRRRATGCCSQVFVQLLQASRLQCRPTLCLLHCNFRAGLEPLHGRPQRTARPHKIVRPNIEIRPGEPLILCQALPCVLKAAPCPLITRWASRSGSSLPCPPDSCCGTPTLSRREAKGLLCTPVTMGDSKIVRAKLRKLLQTVDM